MSAKGWIGSVVVGLIAARALALEGVPPFEWVATGETIPEATAAASIAPDAGVSAGFAGSGRAEDSMKARRYIAAPLTARYGILDGLEAYAVAPFYWGEAPEHFVNYATGGAPEEYRATLNGADFGDPALGARWRAWRADDNERTAVVASLAVVFPLGTNVWTNSQFNYVTSGAPKPDFAVGDGAYKVLAAVEGIWDGPSWRCDAVAGYLYRFAVEATAIEPGASTITVNAPSPVLGWVRPAWKVSDTFWLTARVDGFWSAGGSFATDGLIARDPESLAVVLDSYQHLIRSAGGCWAGLGVREAFSDVWTGSVGFLAPVAVHGMYRVVRAQASLTWSWKP